MTEWERTQESCKHLFNAMEPKLLGVGYTARCIYCGKVSFIDLSKRAKNTEQLLQPDNGYVCNRPGQCAKGQGGKCYSGFDCPDKAIAG